jgi:hypothetical protein
MKDGSVSKIREVFTSDSEFEKVINKVKKIASNSGNPLTASTSNFANDIVEILLLKKIAVFFTNGIHLSIS